MDFVIITGMSGAGKTSALHVLEDIGYYSVDNIPASLLPMLYTLCSKSDDSQMHRVAVVVDVRGTENYKMMNVGIEQFKSEHKDVKILFFDAKNDAIIVRYKETRRRHRLSHRHHLYVQQAAARARAESVLGGHHAGAHTELYVLWLQIRHSA